jgi:hypothetical protein
MKHAHLHGLLAAALISMSFTAYADSQAKISPFDSAPRGSARSVAQSLGDSPAVLRVVPDLAENVVPLADARGAPAELAEMRPRLRMEPKTVANGLYMSGRWDTSWLGSSISLSLAEIDNDSSTRTTGTLRLEVWAVSTPPARGAGFTGYRLSAFSTLEPLPPRTMYNNIVRNGTMSYPPNGTYWLVLALTEYDPANCSQADGYCVSDTSNSERTSTFGNPVVDPPPPANGVATNSLGSRGTVSPSATMFGGFSLAASARVLMLIRGNSLGSLGVTNAFMDAPRVRLYNAAGTDLVFQGGMPGFNFCASSNTTTDLPVIQMYQGRGAPVSSRDSCYTASLAAGTYTFSITPSTSGTSASATSSTFSGEVLFEVTLQRP